MLVDAFGEEYQASLATALKKADENNDEKIDAREVAKFLAADTESESDSDEGLTSDSDDEASL